ncbi:MAG: ornithine carbamoyltransferase [Chloroflexi bacterium]|nr:ornithine carbamoyltransferase [Chloroflexota bacterium]
MARKNLLSIADLASEDISRLLGRARELKQGKPGQHLNGMVLALLFEKPSLRTKVSFDVAMRRLGGHSVYLAQNEVGLGKREPVADVARVLSRYVNGMAVRTFSQALVEDLARYGSVPVINALTDQEHPCQALADMMTIGEKRGGLKGVNLAYVGDGNNVAHSLMLASALTGVNFRLAFPRGYEPQTEIVDRARAFAAKSGSDIKLTQDPQGAVAGADVVYTDVWTSMGQEAESDLRRKVFAPYQVNRKLMALAKKDAIFMHPLPAHAGEEIEAGLLDTPQSAVFDQAENRLHVQMALLEELLGPSPERG